MASIASPKRNGCLKDFPGFRDDKPSINKLSLKQKSRREGKQVSKLLRGLIDTTVSQSKEFTLRKTRLASVRKPDSNTHHISNN